MFTKSNPIKLLVSDHHGIYVPAVFAETVDLSLFGESISAEDVAIIAAGPETEYYWEAWDAILSSAETEDGVSLHQDGDLWAVNWSLIGDADEIAEIGEMAFNRLLTIDGTKELIGDLYRGLMEGPAAGRWNSEMLAELRNIVEEIADKISADLPLYWSTVFGIEERSVDVESLMIAENKALSAIAAYW